MSSRRTLAVVALSASALPAAAASHDGVVEWDGLSHAGWHDRSPRVPVGGEGFTVRFQALRGDLTGARVLFDDGLAGPGGTGGEVEATLVGSRGPYDLWEAAVPPTAAGALTYLIEARDGADADYLGPGGPRDDAAGARFGVDFSTFVHAPLGATPVTGGVVFKVWSPSRATCHVRGAFNGWSLDHPMTRVGENFVAFVPGAQAGEMYKFFFPGALWKPDARAALLAPSDNYNSVVVDQDAFNWTDDAFSPAPLEQMVVYQLHVGSFAGRNDPAGPTPNPSRYVDVAARVGHLAELGVNAVMLNPINEFPGEFSGGYNPISAHAVESRQGDVEDFKSMVDALHGAGIAVLLDIVWNHFAGNENYLWDYDGTQIYFDSPAVGTPWGAQHDYDRVQVRDYFLDAADLFLGEYRLDGYRVDAVMSMVDSGWTPQWPTGQALMRGLNDLVDRRYADKHVIAEKYDDDAWTVGDSSWGLGFDAQYHNRFKNALRDAVFTEASGGSPNVGALAASITGTGSSTGQAAFNYFELHDDAWPLNGHERAVRQFDPSWPSDSEEARGLQTLGNALALTARGVPAILQGTEWLEDDGWEENKIDWSHKTAYAGVFDFYSDLIGLRTTKPALFANSGASVFHVNEGADVVAFERWGDDGRSYVVVANLSSVDFGGYLLGLPRPGEWGVILNNHAAAYGGDGFGSAGSFQTVPIARDGFPQRAALQIPAWGFLLLQHDPELPGCSSADLAEPLGSLDFFDLAAFLTLYNQGDPGADLAAPIGTLNFFDVSAYLSVFNAGCP